MFMHGRGVAFACALAAVLAAGCSSGDKPVALPSLSSSNSPSASPSPTSTATELAAVSALVHRYFELVNGPTTTVAANDLFSMMTAACKCRRVATSMRDLAKKGQHYFGGSVITSFVPSIDGVAAADVLVDYNYRDGGIKDATGRVISHSRGHKNVKVVFRLVKSDGNWRIDIIEAINDGTPT